MAGTDRYAWRPERVRVGTVGRAHGLDGSFAVEGPCGWFRFRPGARLLLDGRPVRIRRGGGTETRPLVAVDDVTDRSGAEALRGTALELPRTALPPPAPESYFHFDLVGCSVESGGQVVGRVAAVEEGVANDVLVLDDAATTRLPFVAAVVPVVDVPGRRLELVEGFLGDPAGGADA